MELKQGLEENKDEDDHKKNADPFAGDSDTDKEEEHNKKKKKKKSKSEDK